MCKKAYKGFGMNGIIASLYKESIDRVYSDYIDMANRIKEFLPSKVDILEVASGPGYLSIELAKETDFKVTGLDIRPTFAEIAMSKAKENNVEVDFKLSKWKSLFISLNFKWVLRKRAYSIEQMEQLVGNSKFFDYQINKGWIGFELWLHKPA